MKNRIPRLLGAGVVVVVLLVYALTCVVHRGEAVLVETFGSSSTVWTSPDDTGVHFVWPWPIQKVHRVDVRQRLFTAESRQVSTADNQLLFVGAFVLWRVADPAAYRDAVGDSEARVEELLAAPLNESIAGEFGRNSFGSLVEARDPGARPPAGPGTLAQIERAIQARLMHDLKPYGLAAVDVGIHRLELPAGATGEVFEQMRQVKARQASRLEAEGQAVAKRIRTEANSAYEQGLVEAKAEAGEIIAKAQAKAAETVAGAAAAELLVFLDKVNTLRELLNDKTTMILDLRTSPLNLLLGLPEAEGDAAAKKERS